MKLYIAKVSWLIAFLLGSLLLFASLSKLTAFDKFMQGLPFLAFIPNSAVPIIAALAIAVELSVGFEAVLRPDNQKTKKALFGVFSFFLALMSCRLIPNVDRIAFPAGCSCFAGAEDIPLFKGNFGHFLISLLLWSLAAVCMWSSQSSTDSDQSPGPRGSIHV